MTLGSTDAICVHRRLSRRLIRPAGHARARDVHGGLVSYGLSRKARMMTGRSKQLLLASVTCLMLVMFSCMDFPLGTCRDWDHDVALGLTVLSIQRILPSIGFGIGAGFGGQQQKL